LACASSLSPLLLDFWQKPRMQKVDIEGKTLKSFDLNWFYNDFSLSVCVLVRSIRLYGYEIKFVKK
jgi:hypothetical protein